MTGLKAVISLGLCLFCPALGYAQGSIAGSVKDSSGAVLPGVTVEASSPALIEKSRSVVTDGAGRYRIVDLRPGTYAVTFTLAGFNSVKREGLELSGSFSATVDVEMRVGAIEETITVSGESPTVDLQNTMRQRVIAKEVIDSLPTGRNHYNLAVLVPGLSIASSGNGGAPQDVGGALPPLTFELTVHGSKGDSQRLLQNGVSLSSPVGGGTRAGAVPSGTSVQEITLDIGAAPAESDTGGVRMNFVPKEGGNMFKGTLYGTFTNDSLEGNNFTQELKNRGLLTPSLMKEVWDINPGVGGPLRKDKLWFYVSVRRNRVANWAGVFRNVNENNPNAWLYVADTSQPFFNQADNYVGNVRLTWQVSPKNKIAGTYDVQNICSCPDRAGATGVGTSRAPEAAFDRSFPAQRAIEADWSAPITSRLLFEAAGIHRIEGWGYKPAIGPGITQPINPLMIPVTDQSTGMTYRAFAPYANNFSWIVYDRAAVSYITGSHAFKIGINDGFGVLGPNSTVNLASQTAYRFNGAVPNQITLYATPYTVITNIDHDFGLFAQDRWTFRRMTLSYGLRYSHFSNSFPEQHLAPALLAPTRDVTFPATSNVSWNDIVPRSGVVYDVFGDGKTAIKVSLNKYLQGQATNGIAGDRNPLNAVVQNTTRSWDDSFYPVGDPRRGNYVPDCDLTNPAKNAECGPMLNQNFGKSVVNRTYDPETLTGWGKRNYNWEFSAGVQRELLPRVSAEVSYFRRWYGRFLVTDNTLVAPSDYTAFKVTAPTDAQLGTSSGTVLTLLDLNPDKVGPVANYVTFSDNYGKMTDHWNGVDVTMNARLKQGVLLQGGISIGKEVADNCEVWAKLPELQFGSTNLTNSDPGLTPSEYCHQEQNLQTQFKLVGVYTVPRVEVQVSGTFQSSPGIQRSANLVLLNAIVAPVLGRNLSGNASSITTQIANPGTLYGERINQLDLRFAKILRSGRTRTSVNVDVYNALNKGTVLQENFAYSAWLTPIQIITPRFVKLGATFDF